MSSSLMTRTLRRKPPAPRLRSRRRQAQELVDNPLRYTLRLLAIQPIDRKSVEQYKEAKLESFFPFTHAERDRKPWMNKLETAISFLLFALGIGLAIFLRALLLTEFSPAWALAIALATAVITERILSSPIRRSQQARREGLESEKTKRTHARWITADLCRFCTAIGTPPSEIMRTADVIKKRLPNAIFEVEYLYKDPFLKVSLHLKGGRIETEYVKAWDEDFVF